MKILYVKNIPPLFHDVKYIPPLFHDVKYIPPLFHDVKYIPPLFDDVIISNNKSTKTFWAPIFGHTYSFIHSLNYYYPLPPHTCEKTTYSREKTHSHSYSTPPPPRLFIFENLGRHEKKFVAECEQTCVVHSSICLCNDFIVRMMKILFVYAMTSLFV